MEPIFAGYIKNGKLLIPAHKQWEGHLATLNGPVVVIVKKPKRSRTLNQNAYYWAAVVSLPAAHFGYTPQEIHDAFRCMFLRKEGRGPPTIGSTANLSTVEFTDYVEKCRQWCAEQNIVIPDPNTYELLKTELWTTTKN